jgi:uncharacterized phage protein (TIGR02216 family)
MGFGLGVLRLSPEVFWGMTLRELAAAVNGIVPTVTATSRLSFDALMKRYPDSLATALPFPQPLPARGRGER